jgi:hypothetical protein
LTSPDTGLAPVADPADPEVLGAGVDVVDGVEVELAPDDAPEPLVEPETVFATPLSRLAAVDPTVVATPDTTGPTGAGA